MNPSASEVRRTPIDWIPTAILFGFAFLFATSQINNYDVWWHLRTGEWILQNRSVPSVDVFSFTAEGTPWIAHYWLSDVIFALVHRVLGLDGLILLCALVVSVSVAVAHRIMVRRGVDPFAAAFLLGLAVVAARFRFMARPHVFMFLFAVVFWWVLDSDLRSRPRRLLWLLPVMLLWVNMHGSFILALAFTGALFVQEGVGLWMARRSEGENPGTSLLLHIGGVGVGLTALCFASPYGPDLPAWVLRDFTSHAVTRTFELGEHAALAWGERPMIWGLMLAAAGSFALAPKKVRVFDLVVAAALTLLAVRSVRMGALASVYYAVVIGTNLMPLAAALRRDAARTTLAPIAAAVASLALVAGGVIGFRATFTPDKAYRFGLGVMESRFPVDAVTFLGDLGFEGNVLNTWEFGGFLLWNLPGARTFSDGRTLDAHMDAVDRTRAMSPDELAAYVGDTDIRAIMVKQGDEPYASFASNSPLFRAVFLDDRAGVYLRQDLYDRYAAQGGIEAFEWIRPASFDQSYLVVLARGPDAEAVEAELRRAVDQSPRSFNAQYMLGTFLEAQDRAEAVDAYARAVELNPALAVTHYDLGVKAGRFALGLQEWERAASIVGRSIQIRETPESFFILGTATQMLGRYEEAEGAFRRVLELDPQSVAARTNLGYVYLDSGSPQQAIESFEEATAMAPEDEAAAYGLALSVHGSGDADRAAGLWRSFLERFPSSRWAPNARAGLEQLGVDGLR